MNHIQVQIADIRLDDQVTETKNRGVKARNVVTNILDPGNADVNNTSVEKSLLGNLAQALIGDNKQTKIPTNPVVKKEQQAKSQASKCYKKITEIIRPYKNRRGGDCERDEQ